MKPQPCVLVRIISLVSRKTKQWYDCFLGPPPFFFRLTGIAIDWSATKTGQKDFGHHCKHDCSTSNVKWLCLWAKGPIESAGKTTDGATVSVISREGCVTKCVAKFLNRSDRLSFARSPAKPMLTFVYTHYTHYSSARYILPKETHRISQKNDTFNTQFPKLTFIRCKFSRVEAHVIKYCCYVMLGMIGHTAEYAFGTPRLFSPCSPRVPRIQPRCAE